MLNKESTLSRIEFNRFVRKGQFSMRFNSEPMKLHRTTVIQVDLFQQYRRQTT